MSRASNEFRLFVSSTFTDLQPERDELVKKTFPRIRAKCRERGVEFTEIDLRWGISDEESRAGQTIRICLEEIDRCRPYFIGILGSRYGWVPSITEIARDPEILAEFPWLREYGEKSIIEMEFAHGAIRDKNDSAFFYEQEQEQNSSDPTDPSPNLSPKGERDNSKNSPLPLGRGRGRVVGSLENLKDTLQSSTTNYRRFASPEELGEQVYRDLLAILDRDWPLAEEQSPLEIARAAHRAFAINRRRSYVADPEYLRAFEEFVESDSAPLVIWGRSGFGKSALFAHLAAEHERLNPGAFVVSYFVGAAAEGSDQFDLMRHVMAEIKERYDVADELPASDDAVREEFPVWLAKVGDSGKRIVDSGERIVESEVKNTAGKEEIHESLSTIRYPLSTPNVVLFIDAVNQLSGIGPEMHWLPEFIPPNVRLVISTTPEQPLEELRKRGWQELEIQPLWAPQRSRIADGFLGRYRKSLPEDALANIAASPRTESPLFLRTLLEELRVFGRHSTLNAYLENYLASKDERDLFDKVLARLERDHGEVTVRAVMTAIWAARHGLSETELIEITGVTRMALSTLLIAMEYHLMQREGLYTFFHNYLREGVELRYLSANSPSYAAERSRRGLGGGPSGAHEMLATYFAAQECTPRRREEEPWQWRAAHNIDALWRSLADPEMFMLFANDDERYHFIAYLQSFERERTQELFRALHDAMRSDPTFDRGLELAQTARIAGYYDAATDILTAISQQAATIELDYKASLRIRREQSQLYSEKHEYKLALPLCEEIVALIESKEGKSAELFNAMIDLSTAMYGFADYIGAERVIRRALEFEDSSSAIIRLIAIQNLATYVLAQGLYDEAVILHEQALEGANKLLGSMHPTSLLCSMNLGAALIFAGRIKDALESMETTLPGIRNTLGDKHSWYFSCLEQVSKIFLSSGDYGAAERAVLELIEKSSQSHGRESEKTSLYYLGLGRIYYAKGELPTALRIYQTHLPTLADHLGSDHPSVVRSAKTLSDIATALNQNKEGAGPPSP